MGESASFRISSAEEAAEAIDYFNGFHDGFIKRMTISSQDEIDQDRGQTCTGLFDIDIDFAHYNYKSGDEPLRPYDQIVHARFRNIQDLFCDFREGFLGNTIINLSIVLMNRQRGGSTATEQCLGLQWARHYYLADFRRYELRESQLFTFTDAEFHERPARA